MQSYTANPGKGVLLRKDRLITLVACICIFPVTACAKLNSNPTSPIRGAGGSAADVHIADVNDAAMDGKGPTMLMSYSPDICIDNPIGSFTYFVPLISLTLVDNISSVNNNQQVSIRSHRIKANSKSFRAACEFEILGSGFQMNTFDSVGLIAAHSDELKEGETLTNMLDYIKFEGNGYGLIEVKGRITGSARTVTEVDIRFNARGHRSPVTIGLYDIKPKNGQYVYENRSNEVVARVNALAFKKTDQAPRLGIKVASVAKGSAPTGLFAGLKGAIANLLITPPKINPRGQAVMLQFGEALAEKKPAFTFPKAENIKENKVLDIETIEKRRK